LSSDYYKPKNRRLSSLSLLLARDSKNSSGDRLEGAEFLVEHSLPEKETEQENTAKAQICFYQDKGITGH